MKTPEKPKVIRAAGFANGTPCPHEGQFLKSFDHEAHRGQGEGDFTANAAEAMKFKGTTEAFEFWRRQSKTRKLRPDGKPNRPLTSLSIMIEDAP